MVFCLEVSEPLPYTKGRHNVYIAKKEQWQKRTGILIYKKREIFLTNFEEGTLVDANIVILTGLAVYGHISRGIFGPFSYPLLMSMHRAFLQDNSMCVVYLGRKRERKCTKGQIVIFFLTLGPCGRLHPTKGLK